MQSSYQHKEEEIDIVSILKHLLKDKRKLSFITLTFFLVSIFYASKLPNVYTSHAILAPNIEDKSGPNLSSYSAIAGIAGIGLPSESYSKSQEAMERLKSLDFFTNQFLPYVKLENIFAVEDWNAITNKLKYDESLYNSSKGQIDEINNQKYNINSLAGIAKSNPILAASLTILIFSFAGIPPMSGFFSKFYILFSMVKSGHYILALIAIISSVISCFYYLRIVKIMYFDKKIENSTISIIRCNANIILIISAIIAIAAPLYFSPLINLVEGNIIHIFKNGG